MRNSILALCGLLLWVFAFRALASEAQGLTAKKVKTKDGYVFTYFVDGKKVATQIRDAKGEAVQTEGTIPDGKIRVYDERGDLSSESQYRDGKKNGVTKYYFKDGKLDELRTFKDGKANGPATIYSDKDASYKTVGYVDGKREGIMKVYAPDGHLKFEVMFRGDVMNGPATMYFPGGKMEHTMTYRDGELEGLLKTYAEDGTLRLSITYREGKENGPMTVYYENGKIRNVSNVKNGIFEGPSTHYRENGTVLSTAQLRNNVWDGAYVSYDDQGNVLEKTRYYKGEKAGADQTYFSTGDLAQSTYVRNKAREEDFQAAAKAYHVAAGSMKLPPEARKLAEQAEDALRKKQFDAAADRYREAVDLVPWWPQGHYNLAEILGAEGQKQEAADEMAKYLALLPEAGDKEDAQRDISQWRGGAGQ